jgi:two-component system, NtrC family, nitrogen regulation response regulator NtrX
VGGDKPIAVDVRVLVATHRNLEQLVAEGRFRQDLFHRVYVFPLMLPPLRERAEDIPVLVEHFAAQVSAQNGWKPMRFSDEAIRALRQYVWPGNVRELRNVVERLMLLAANGEVDADCVELALPQLRSVAPRMGTSESPGSAAQADWCPRFAPVFSGGNLGAHSGVESENGTLADRVTAYERETILAELARQHNHITNAAKALGLERSHLYKKCLQLGIDLRAVRERGV